jgi:4-hydroxy-4-methyl-2-oxoglutarate aldolase
MTAIKPSNSISSEDMIRRYGALYSASIYDILDERGLPDQVLSLDIGPLSPDQVVAGWALTVRGAAEPRRHEELAAQEPGQADFFGLIAQVYPGCVLVMDTGKSLNTGQWGELTGTAAQARGCVGVVIDGGTRDTRHLRQMGLPVFARYSSCIESNRRWAITDYNKPILVSGATVAGVTVHPGDFICGDCDGTIVIPRDIAEAVLLEAEGVATTENEVRAALRSGEDAAQVFERLKRF